jgi:hypothetical protein|tara:strand:- start:135 stop:404 length:270 start_codon:yes stop_codon:yes gene_type:complete
MRIAVDVIRGAPGSDEAIASAFKALEGNPGNYSSTFLNKNILWSTQERHDLNTIGGTPLPCLNALVTIVYEDARAASMAKTSVQAAAVS